MLFGFLILNKPVGLTSHDVVARIRRELRKRKLDLKIGHAGTLDPMATGVLVICLGQATRLSDYVMQSSKRYLAEVHLGITTDTYDAEGQILRERDASAITREDVEAALTQFQGEIDQIPPMYSAIKQDGKKLYDLARAGKTVERKARKVTLESVELLDWTPPTLRLDVRCSAGTYIRSLAYDLGEKLGVGAHLSGLVRAASGGFTLENALELDRLLESDSWEAYLVPPEVVFSDWHKLYLNAEEAIDVQHGRYLIRDEAGRANAAAAYANGRMIALLQAEGNFWKPHKVFSNQT